MLLLNILLAGLGLASGISAAATPKRQENTIVGDGDVYYCTNADGSRNPSDNMCIAAGALFLGGGNCCIDPATNQAEELWKGCKANSNWEGGISSDGHVCTLPKAKPKRQENDILGDGTVLYCTNPDSSKNPSDNMCIAVGAKNLGGGDCCIDPNTDQAIQLLRGCQANSNYEGGIASDGVSCSLGL